MRRLLAALLAVLIAVPPAYAQERRTYGQAELDQLLAPVALYPDALLSQVLMASTYPLEVVEAARWSRAHPGLQGEEAVRAAADKDWDPSVKSLLAFPQLLARMDEKLDWTRRLGDAFLAQEAQVMGTVQDLRRRAQATGNLLPDERQRVTADGGTIIIEAADPRFVYVPYYDPFIVYGPWWWSGYPPVVWAPWPGYVVARPGFWWGVGVGITAGFFFGGVDWHQRHVRVVHVNNYYVQPPVVRRQVTVVRTIAPGRWEHDPSHRRGIVYRHPEVQKKYSSAVPQRELHKEPRPGAVAPADRRFERRDAQPPTRPQADRSPAPRLERQREDRAPAGRKFERPDSPPQARPQPERAPAPRHEPRREERQEPRRDDRRGQVMPPAFTASSPPRIEARQAHRIEARAQPRFEAQRSQPRLEAPQRQAPRLEHRGGGWREHAGRNDRRG